MAGIAEKQDEALKARSREWWSRHSQDYVDSGEISHTGIRPDMSDEEFLDYLEKIDRGFAQDAYFAQKRGDPLFSGLMPVDSLAGRKVLEIGCGLGAHSEMLCRAGAELTSIDLSPTSIETTRRRLALKGLSARVQESDAEKLPFEDESFDYVWSWGVIHHSPRTLTCAQEITRVLKPGGRLGVMIYNRNSMYNWINVVFRYGVLRGKILRLSFQDLRNNYTDGKYLGGAPLSKYFTRREIRNALFPELEIERQIAFEQKKAVSFLVPAKWRRGFEARIPDGLYTFLWARMGFLTFTEARKPGKPSQRAG